MSETKKVTFRSKIHLWLVQLWDAAVLLVVQFMCEVLEHPKVKESFGALLLSAFHNVLDDPSLVDKIDGVTKEIMFDLSRHETTARNLGKDTPKLVKGFVGGLMTNVSMRATKSIGTTEEKEASTRSAGKSQADKKTE